MRVLPARCGPGGSSVALVVTLALAVVAPACTSTTNEVTGSAATGAEEPTPEATLTPAAETIEESSAGYSVQIEPASFVDRIDNPYLPLEPGTRWVLKGKSDEGKEIDTIEVLERTRKVMGVTTTVVLDVVTLDGELAEKTWDWYAQDIQGNVWYFGEKTAEYENGKKISTHGAWEAGVDGALPGIIMAADPQVNVASRQEYYPGEAVDMSWVVRTNITKKTPYARFKDVIHTLEWSPLEPDVVGEKFYAPGVGLIWERNLAGGFEFFELVEVTGA